MKRIHNLNSMGNEECERNKRRKGRTEERRATRSSAAAEKCSTLQVRRAIERLRHCSSAVGYFINLLMLLLSLLLSLCSTIHSLVFIKYSISLPQFYSESRFFYNEIILYFWDEDLFPALSHYT